MRLLLVVLTISLLGFSTTAKAQEGCAAINDVLGLIPQAFKTIMYYEGYRLHHHGEFKFRSEVRCNTNNIFDTLDQVLNLLCATIDGLSTGASNPMVNSINTKLDSIKDDLISINGAEMLITDTDQLKKYLDDKMLSINDDITDIINLVPKADTNPKPSNMGEHNNGWIRYSDRNDCINKDSTPPTTEEERELAEKEKNAESAANELARLKEIEREYEAIRDDRLEIFNNASLAYSNYLAANGLIECPTINTRQNTCRQLLSNMNVAATNLAEAEADLAKASIDVAAAQANMDAAMDAVMGTINTNPD